MTLQRHVPFLVVMAAIAAALSGCASSGKAETTSEAERPGTHKPPASNGNRAGAGPFFHQAEYDLETEWTQDTSDRRAGPYLRSVWHDPAAAGYKLVISSRPSRNFAPPLAAAELSRMKARHLRKYREMSFKKVKIGHPAVPAVRFIYYAGGEDYIEYFFAKCGTSIAFQGSTNPGSLKLFSWFYENTASQVKPVCAE